MRHTIRRSDLVVPVNYELWFAEPIFGDQFRKVAVIEAPNRLRNEGMDTVLEWLFANAQNIDGPWTSRWPSLQSLDLRSMSVGDLIVPAGSSVAFECRAIGFNRYVLGN